MTEVEGLLQTQSSVALAVVVAITAGVALRSAVELGGQLLARRLRARRG